MNDQELEELLTRTGALTEDEVVTHALSRDVTLPYGAGTAVLITLDNGHDHKRPNTLGPRSLAELNAAIDKASARPDVAAVALTGKPFIFAAGADLTGIAKLTDRQQALDIARLGHAVLDKLHHSPVPTFTFLNGVALGGGLEVALHCHYRTVSAHAAGIGLPECFLGLLPGWGGNFILPNLIGPERAVTVMIDNPLNANRMLAGPQVARLGIADAVFEGADFLERSLDWAAQVVAGTLVVERPEVDRDEQLWSSAIAAGREIADEKTRGNAPGPYRALALLEQARTANRETAFAAEDEALADLIMSEQLRAGLYAFNLVQKRAKKPAGAPDPTLARPITKVGVVGAGLMATQLALLFLRRFEVPVVISDVDSDRVNRGVTRLHGEIDRLLAKSRVSTDQANRMKASIIPTVDHADYADCDFVLEAVFEELAVKKDVFASLEKHVGETCVLATNTSSLSVTEMAADLSHPERVIGFHFFNPVSVLPLLEVARGTATDDACVATALAVAKQLKKNAVLMADAPAFVVNRLLIRVMSVIIEAFDAGTPAPVADRALSPLGLPMPPFVLLQLVGPAIVLHATETLNAAFGDRFPVSANLRALVSSGRSGIYDWNADGEAYVSDETAALFTFGDTPSSEQELRDRALAALAEEAGLILAEQVVAAPMDIDLAMILGAGASFASGGVLPYLDREGVSERVLGRRFLPRGVASLP